MPRLDKESLKKITVYIGEKNYYERQQLRDMFKSQGLTQIVCHANLDAMKEVMMQVPPDLLVISDDFDTDVFSAIRLIRNQKLGDNPFMLITMLVSANRPHSLKQAISIGVDDIIVKPLTTERIQERLRLVTFHRQPFIVTDDYLGPQRKNMEVTGRVRRIAVLNTMLEKVNGREFDKNALRDAVEGSLQEVLQAKLDSQSFRLGEVCERLITAYDTNLVTEDVQNDLIMLADVLGEAAGVAKKLRDNSLAGLCEQLGENVRGIADHYDDVTPSEIDLIRKVTAAFKMAMNSGPAAVDEQPDSLDLAALN
ncbi:MAG: response regulator transcription factor [Rhodospirillaceae bacterium]|nr:response regulator transcription factor [Rhodospirillaceae bacterium]